MGEGVKWLTHESAWFYHDNNKKLKTTLFRNYLNYIEQFRSVQQVQWSDLDLMILAKEVCRNEQDPSRHITFIPKWIKMDHGVIT